MQSRVLRSVRIAAWSSIVVIALLSLLPSEYVMRSNLGPHAEHVLTYAATTSIIALAYRSSRMTSILAGLLSYAACLEYLQRFSFGRSSSIEDFTFSALGISAGMVLVLGASKLWTWLARTGHKGSELPQTMTEPLA